ncbi:hypothetical protein ElyMa_004315800 [Elysia marginata]|uniref:Uncharacterized protein n=1 Tax=Elysia marginata TaxID=1093978 RepID=A0AAV4GZB8_9GAST|nr:hypothetical protein ElyMa_004315800 [Elysia marginata]
MGSLIIGCAAQFDGSCVASFALPWVAGINKQNTVAVRLRIITLIKIALSSSPPPSSSLLAATTAAAAAVVVAVVVVVVVVVVIIVVVVVKAAAVISVTDINVRYGPRNMPLEMASNGEVSYSVTNLDSALTMLMAVYVHGEEAVKDTKQIALRNTTGGVERL